MWQEIQDNYLPTNIQSFHYKHSIWPHNNK